MTATPFDTTSDPAAQLVHALPPRARRALNPTGRFAALARRAIDAGWTIDTLAHELTRDSDGIANLGGLMTFRLEKAATVGPPALATPAVFAPLPFCSPECAARRGHIEDADGYPTGERCPCRKATP